MADVLKEAIRIVLETEGREGVEQLRRALAEVGDVSADMLAPVNGLLDSMNGLNDAAGKASRVAELGAALEKTTQDLDDASRAALALTLQVGGVDKPTKEMTNALKLASAEVKRLEQQQRTQSATLAKASSDLQKAGVNTERLADEQARLRSEIVKTKAAIEEQSRAVRAQAEANRALKDRLSEGDEKFRRMTAANRASADALRDYRTRAAAAAKETSNMSAEAGRTAGIFSRLSGVFAGLVGFVSLRGAVQGVQGLLGLGDAAEKARIRLEALYGSQEAGNRAYGAIRELSRANAIGFAELTEAAAKLKGFGLEPLDGTLQAVIDQNARLGGSNETLNGIILALGQAWAKQKLQGEEILQLVERGVPVWDLLAKATGKNVQELQRLSERGELSRDVIKALIEEIGKGAQGAAASQLNTFSALFASLLDRVQRFFTEVSDRGVMGFFKQQLGEINAQIDKMAASGQLQAYAQGIANTVVAAAKGIRDATAWVVEHRTALVTLGRAFVLLKLGRVIADLAAYSRAMLVSARNTLLLNGAIGTTSGALTRLGALIKSIPRALQIGLVLVGLDVLWRGIVKARDGLAELVGWTDKLREAQYASDRALREAGKAASEAGQAYVEFKDTVVLTAAEIAKLSAAELASYRERLAGLREYQAGQATYLSTVISVGEATAEQKAQYLELKKALDVTRAGFEALKPSIQNAEAALATGLSTQVQAFIEKLKGVAESGKVATTTLGALFETQDFQNSNRLGDLAVAIAQLASEGRGADLAVREGLLATLEKLSGEALLRYQSAAIAAFEETKTGAAGAAAVLETTLLAAMLRLGVAPEKLGVAFTDMGKDAIAAFNTVLENANSTSAQIESAFKAALSRASTPEEARTLGALLKQAGEDGKLGFDAAERAAADLRDRIKQIQVALDPLADEFKRLGIESQRELDRAAAAARASFQAIVAGSDKSRAAINDVRRAFVAYAQTELDAVKGTDAAAQRRVEAELRVLASVNNVSDALSELGLEALDAGSDVAAGADRGTAALDRTAAAAGRTASNLGRAASSAGVAAQEIGQVANEAENAGAGLRDMGAAAGTTTVGVFQLTEALQQAFVGLSRWAGSPLFAKNLSVITDEIQRQTETVAGLNAELDAQVKQLDPLSKELELLKAQYNFVDEGALRQIAEKRRRLKEDRERAADERRALRRERNEAALDDNKADRDTSASRRTSASSGTRSSGGAGGEVFTVRLLAGDQSVELEVQGSPDRFTTFMRDLQQQRANSNGGRG